MNSRLQTIPIERHDNHVYLPVEAGGRWWSFILDTGAGASVVSMRAARALAVPLAGPLIAKGAGDSSVSGALLPSPLVAYPGGDRNNGVALIGALPFDDLEQHAGRPIDGILGYDFIARQVVEIDYCGGQLRLHHQEAFAYRGRGAIVPLAIKHNHPHVQASLELEPGVWVGGDFVVDIGSRLAVAIAKPFADRHQLITRIGPTLPSSIGRGIGGAAAAQVGRARALRAGSFEVPAPEVSVFGDGAGVLTSGYYFDGNIGAAVLRDHRVFFDYRGGQLILEDCRAVAGCQSRPNTPPSGTA